MSSEALPRGSSGPGTFLEKVDSLRQRLVPGKFRLTASSYDKGGISPAPSRYPLSGARRPGDGRVDARA